MISFLALAVLKFLGLLPYDSDGVFTHLFTTNLDHSVGEEKRRRKRDSKKTFSYPEELSGHGLFPDSSSTARCSTKIKVNEKTIILSWESSEVMETAIDGCGDAMLGSLGCLYSSSPNDTACNIQAKVSTWLEESKIFHDSTTFSSTNC